MKPLHPSDADGPFRPAVLHCRAGDDRNGVPPARRSSAFWVALACWAMPLIAVLSTSAAAAVAADSRSVAVAGIVLVGVPLSFVGAIAAIAFAAGRLAAARDRWRECVRPAAVLLLLLASNYGVVFVCYLFAAGQV